MEMGLNLFPNQRNCLQRQRSNKKPIPMGLGLFKHGFLRRIFPWKFHLAWSHYWTNAFNKKQQLLEPFCLGRADPTCEFKKVQVESCLEFVLAILTCLTKNRPEENQYLCYFEKCNLPFRLSMFSPPKMPLFEVQFMCLSFSMSTFVAVFPHWGRFCIQDLQVNLNWSHIFHSTGWLIS